MINLKVFAAIESSTPVDMLYRVYADREGDGTTAL